MNKRAKTVGAQAYSGNGGGKEVNNAHLLTFSLDSCPRSLIVKEDPG